MSRTLKLIRTTLGLTCSVLLMASAAAQAFPTRPIKLVNTFPPGGPSDLIARSVAHVLQQSLKQPVIVENRAGAAGNIGTDVVAKSAPDGYTILMGIDTTFTINPYIYVAAIQDDRLPTTDGHGLARPAGGQPTDRLEPGRPGQDARARA